MRTLTKGELARKAIHYTASLIPLIYYFFVERRTALIILGIISVIMLVAEVSRMLVPPLFSLYLKIFGWMIREHETKNSLTGATFVFIGSFLTIFFFPKDIATTVLLFLTIGDPTACLFGMSFGKIKIFNKTLEGTLAFVISSFIATIWIPGIPLHVKLVGVITAAAVELLPKNFDDNIAIPIISGIVISLLGL
ncbi:MAG TPA: hypothetical protein ENF20_00760 [Candidatus Marinimicrobia bacterium]|nr:hypothetical protein [Candidatus Neomarinimicrobiota bacterium]